MGHRSFLTTKLENYRSVQQKKIIYLKSLCKLTFSIYIFLHGYFIKADELSNNSRIFFHWASVDSNRTVLNLGGGYQGYDHFNGLNKNIRAELNEVLMQKFREWYIKGEKFDLAGPGFYVSNDPLDSRTFGNDLLIIEINSKSSSYINIDRKIKARADKALEDNDFSKLPFMTSYNSIDSKEGSWNVISRPLNNDEKSQIEIIIRTPSSDDVKRIWKNILSTGEDNLIELTRFLSILALQLNLEENRVTRAAEIIFERILYDLAPQEIIKLMKTFSINLNNKNNRDLENFNYLKNVMEFFWKKIPNDVRTTEMQTQFINRIHENLKENHDLFKVPEVFDFFISYIKVLPLNKKITTLDWMLASFDSSIFKKNYHLAIDAISEVLPFLNPIEKLKYQKSLLRLYSSNPTLPNSNNFLDIYTKLKEIFGKVRARSMVNHMILYETHRLVNILTLPDVSETDKNTINKQNQRVPSIAASEINDQFKKILELISTYPSAEFDKFIKDYIEVLFKPKKFSSAYAYNVRETILIEIYNKINDDTLKDQYKAMIRNFQDSYNDRKETVDIQNLKKIDSTEADKYVRKLARQAGLENSDTTSILDLSSQLIKKPEFKYKLLGGVYQRKDPIGKMPSQSPLEVYLSNHIFDSEKLAENFETRFNQLLVDFPDQALALVEVMNKLSKYQSFSSIPFLKLAEKARGQSQFYKDKTENQWHVLYLKMSIVYQNFNLIPPSEVEFKKTYKNQILNINSNFDYSNISRIFLLIDPLFVTEDLRLMNAKYPQFRFNELVTVKNQTQVANPTWENFSESWYFLSNVLWLKNPNQYSQQFLDSYNKLNEIDLQMRREAKFPNDNWTRSKYSTFVSNQVWDQWKLEEFQIELSRFFDIEKSEQGYILKFLDEEALKKKIPGLSRYSIPETPLSVKLLNFIISDSMKLKHPVQRAARILYLMTRMHPFEDHNGRFGRLIAAAELMKSGYSIPFGFTTNDFFMSQRRIEWEVRRSILLGKMWESMLKQALNNGVSPDDFFQSVYRNSALEGLSLISPTKTEDLIAFVKWLEIQTEAPFWGKDFIKLIEKELHDLNSSGRKLNSMNEMERFSLVDKVWQKFNIELKNKGILNLDSMKAVTEKGAPKCGKIFDFS